MKIYDLINRKHKIKRVKEYKPFITKNINVLHSSKQEKLTTKAIKKQHRTSETVWQAKATATMPHYLSLVPRPTRQRRESDSFKLSPDCHIHAMMCIHGAGEMP